jgi:diguanylate cyclase (GGDEF)-like protein
MTRREAGGAPLPRRRLRSVSITTRLLALVLLPLLGMLVMAAGQVEDRQATASSSAQVHHAVDRIGRLVTLRTALYRERAYMATVLLIRSAGIITVPEASKLVGYDLEAALRQYEAEADRAVDALGEDAAVLTPAELVELRADVERAEVDQDRPTARYISVEVRLDDLKQRVLDDLQPHLAIAGATRVADGLTAVRLEQELVPVSFDESSIVDHLFRAVGSPPDLFRRMTVATTTEDRNLAVIGQLSDPVIAGLSRQFQDSADFRAYRVLTEKVLAGDYPTLADGPDDWLALNDLNLTSLHRMEHLYALLDRSMGSISGNAAALEADAQRELVVGSAAFAGLAVGSLGLCVLLAASITRPLRRLRDHAAELGAGNVTVERLPDQGPADVQVAARAFNDLVDNLRLLDAKNQALAELDFDAEVLGRPLPGALGRSLDGSLAALAGSINERDELRDRILHEASHDPVTTLHNRAAALDRLEAALARAQRTGRGVGIVVLDIDGFRRLNDAHGHSFGDRVLAEVGHRLRREATVSSLVARMGADEFLVLVEDLVDPAPLTELARHLVASLREPLAVRLTTVDVHVAVGLAVSWDGHEDPGQLLAAADLALGRAKERGAGSVEIYDPELQEQLVVQAAIEEALTRALTAPTSDPDTGLFLQYQPVIDVATGQMTSVEALVRWNRRGIGIQPPDSFIPVAERSNLIIELDRWVLRAAIRQLADWSGDPELGEIPIAVNVSGRHLTSQTLLAHVRELLDAGGTDPGRLVVEITETAIIDDLDAAATQLEGLRALGVRVALDDFGTGYTSIAHLRQLPVDIVKIDRSFVERITSAGDRALLRLVCETGHVFGTTITAEGVETAEQYEMLDDLRCDRAQGFLMSRPLLPGPLADWARERRAVSAGATIARSW